MILSKIIVVEGGTVVEKEIEEEIVVGTETEEEIVAVREIDEGIIVGTEIDEGIVVGTDINEPSQVIVIEKVDTIAHDLGLGNRNHCNLSIIYTCN